MNKEQPAVEPQGDRDEFICNLDEFYAAMPMTAWWCSTRAKLIAAYDAALATPSASLTGAARDAALEEAARYFESYNPDVWMKITCAHAAYLMRFLATQPLKDTP